VGGQAGELTIAGSQWCSQRDSLTCLKSGTSSCLLNRIDSGSKEEAAFAWFCGANTTKVVIHHYDITLAFANHDHGPVFWFGDDCAAVMAWGSWGPEEETLVVPVQVRVTLHR